MPQLRCGTLQRSLLEKVMIGPTAIWRLHPNATFTSLRAALLLCTTALLAGAVAITGDNFSLSYLSAATFTYVLLCILFICRYTKMKHQAIMIRDNHLLIPRFFWRDHRLPLDQLSSLEEFFDARGTCVVLLGRLGQRGIFIERRIFESHQGFCDFLDIMTQVTNRSRARNPTGPQIEAVAIRNKNRKKYVEFLALVWALIYIFAADSGFERIKYETLAHGGLIKETLPTLELYRLASSFFLHHDPIHLGLNVLSLAFIGRHVDVVLGHVRFTNIIFLSALFASVTSLLFSPFEVVAGASGGLNGLIGAYAFVCLRYQQQLPASVFVSKRTIFSIIIIQVLFDLASPNTDISSHLGGLAFGILYSIFAIRKYSLDMTARISPTELFCCRVLVLGYGAGLAYFLLSRL